MKTGLVTTDTYLNHNTGQGHPERADRVTVVIDHLKKLQELNLNYRQLEELLMQGLLEKLLHA